MHAIPDKPGVYLFKDKNDNILYIGKAKSLKKRVKSYFRKTDNLKTKLLISKYNKIDFIICSSEKEALILENNLIKKYLPFFNILLKDDKTYPYIIITDEKFPRIVKMRKIPSKYKNKFGPYVEGGKINALIDILATFFKIRTCRRMKDSACLRKYIGYCAAPCQNEISEQHYNLQINNIIEILKGNTFLFIKDLNKEMEFASHNLNFEKAALIRDVIGFLKDIKNNQYAQISRENTFDVLAISMNSNSFVISIQRYNSGKLLDYENIICDYLDIEEDVQRVLIQFYERNTQTIQAYIDEKIFNIIKNAISYINADFTVPKIGENARLVENASKNSDILLGNTSDIISDLKKSLLLKNTPMRIECYDISNISGEFAVGSMVVFENGRNINKKYRKFKIKTIIGADDFHMLLEVLKRRLEHKEWIMPDLIIIDGGKGQISTVKDIIPHSIDLISIAKKEEIIYFPDFRELKLPKNNKVLNLIQRIRDEAHRFAITSYRKIHSKAFFSSEFDNIKGIGQKTVDKLMKNFFSYDKIKKADIDSLAKVIGKKQAKILYNHFRSEENK
ncbi:MAG: excinuclease ABC subunit UvrC [Candidatus Muirbacterium halophilum]|nr:excinuclease ABC subunit UvrC [Candidatus Muirbacterium halophilum]MCK9476939.1 excinuclease ABC subunit UvrC [Candidatus Muirbacterium halophilum]